MDEKLKNLQEAANQAGTSFWRKYRYLLIAGASLLTAGLILGKCALG